nr:MAG TPA: hypothetical protein [Caudoviricetes sp.]
MDAQKIKAMMNKEIFNNMNDQGAAQALREIFFKSENDFNWEEIYNIMITFMPELGLYDGYKAENME